MGCSVAATRPVQEMSNAETAIRAAKDLNADSLAPELYRKANDYHFKAKREYRLKNFDLARKYAVRAMRYAEEAEFLALKGGGATVNADLLESEEGATPDAEASFEEIPGEPTVPFEEDPKPKNEKPSTKSEDSGTDYNAYVRNQEREAQEAKEREAAEKAASDKAKASAKQPQDGYSRGPESPRLLAQNFNRDYQSNPAIRTGSLSRAIGPSVRLDSPTPPKANTSNPKVIYLPRTGTEQSAPESGNSEADVYGEIEDFNPEEPPVVGEDERSDQTALAASASPKPSPKGEQ